MAAQSGESRGHPTSVKNDSEPSPTSMDQSFFESEQKLETSLNTGMWVRVGCLSALLFYLLVALFIASLFLKVVH